MTIVFLPLALVMALAGPFNHGSATPPYARAQHVNCRVVRIAAGPRGVEAGGEYRLQEERTAFSRAHDTQATVYFKWEAAPGLHHLAATWRTPDGGSTASNAFDYKAADRVFGAYWTIPISPATPAGKWTIDATVDAAPCGSFSFDIVDAEARPVGAVRRPLSPAELFERLQSVFVPIERGVTGRPVPDRAAGFLFEPGILATSFSALDATDTVHVAFPKNVRREVTSVIAWNRWQDWALVPTELEGMPLRAGARAVTGDRVYSLEVGPTGARVLAEGGIIGNTTAPSGERLIASFTTGEPVSGAPVVNEFGEAIGLIGGALIPGATTMRERLHARAELHGQVVVPLSTITVPTSPPAATLADLRRRGVTLAPVVAEDSVIEAGFAREIQRGRPVDQRRDFTAADKRFSLFIGWDPRQRLRGMMRLRIYDTEGRLLIESKAAKTDLKPGSSSTTDWQVPVPSRAGVYRAEAVLDERTLWRGFFTVR